MTGVAGGGGSAGGCGGTLIVGTKRGCSTVAGRGSHTRGYKIMLGRYTGARAAGTATRGPRAYRSIHIINRWAVNSTPVHVGGNDVEGYLCVAGWGVLNDFQLAEMPPTLSF